MPKPQPPKAPEPVTLETNHLELAVLKLMVRVALNHLDEVPERAQNLARKIGQDLQVDPNQS
ncbi:hypothetical protein [Bowmanella dokdonensis]|uniref:Uncharacterized protein n=1 Tax=Bowmanella dokdonensis TaxID=751969 RepID=A0A939DLN9_9ALTE|nr:hypothetical protein [Bowmanella dokdonensis]MBN7824768.1 hypothetical protein [Bowmanella dokdonensis]